MLPCYYFTRPCTLRLAGLIDQEPAIIIQRVMDQHSNCVTLKHSGITSKFVTPTAPSCIDNSWRSTTLPAADSASVAGGPIGIFLLNPGRDRSQPRPINTQSPLTGQALGITTRRPQQHTGQITGSWQAAVTGPVVVPSALHTSGRP